MDLMTVILATRVIHGKVKPKQHHTVPFEREVIQEGAKIGVIVASGTIFLVPVSVIPVQVVT